MPAPLTATLATKTAVIATAPANTQVSTARSNWDNSRVNRDKVKALLNGMARGRRLCMYCSDQMGTDVDHYRPLALFPLLTWEWNNHILACKLCNSTHKRDLFPVSPSGSPLFLNPTLDDPWQHLRLSPTTGLYRGVTPEGDHTASVLLNGSLLATGRQAAWMDIIDYVQRYDDAIVTGDANGASELKFRITQRPNLDTFYFLLRYSTSPGAPRIIKPPAALSSVLKHWTAFRSWI